MAVNAIGLVHVHGGVLALERWWYRTLVGRHARAHGLRLVEVVELGDGGSVDGPELRRLATIAARSDAVALVTHGIWPDLARCVAEDLRLRHLPASDRPGVPAA